MNPCEATSATRMALRSSSFVADIVEGDVVGSMSEIEERVPEATRCSLTRMVVSVRMSEGEGDAEAVVDDTAMKVLAEDGVGVKN